MGAKNGGGGNLDLFSEPGVHGVYKAESKILIHSVNREQLLNRYSVQGLHLYSRPRRGF
jgi:hypothetical protein